MPSNRDCWAKIDKTSGSGDSTLNIYFDDNDTGENRSAKICVSNSGADLKKCYTLVQKKKETVTYYNDRVGQFFTKNNCASNQRGERLEYVVPAGKYSSTISKEEANRLAYLDIDNNGQKWVNDNGQCLTDVWYNAIQSGEFTKNDCDPDTEKGTTVTYTVPAGTYSSSISQADADQKAKDDVAENGQAYANAHGDCETIRWYNREQKKSFQKNDCSVTETGTFVEYVVPAGKYYSGVSQADADDMALKDIEENGQDYANQNGECATSTWYNKEQKKSFTKNDCPDGKVGTSVEYVVAAGKYSSTVSQEDADQKAIDEIEQNGQQNANLEGECVDDPNYFVGKASKEFQKEGCDEETQYGSTVTVTQDDVTGGPFISHESQQAADALAMEAVEAQGQAIANERGTCLDKNAYTGVYSKEFTKSDCADGGTGSKVTVTQDDVEGGPFISYESQAAANALAQAAVEEQGQAIANENGECTWTGEYSEVFTKDDCEEDQYGSKMEISETDVEGYPFTSNVSKADADRKAEEAVKAQGQAIVNEQGTCNDRTLYTGRYSKEFTKDNCDDEGVGSKVTVTQNDVTGGPFTSYESQEAANALAQAAVEEQGQEIANTKGTCTWTGSYSETFTKNDCEPDQTGGQVEVNDEDCEGYPFTSNISKADADRKAQEAVKAQGQEIANERGDCEDRTVYTGRYSQKFTKNNCADNGVGSEVTVTQNDVVGGPFTSYESQGAADALAQAAVEDQGQEIANTKGTCTWTGSYEKQFTKNDCDEGQQGSTVTVSEEDCIGYPFTSNESQADANQKAQEAVESQGQGIANTRGNCENMTVYTGNYSAQFTPNCEVCEEGVPMEVTATMVNGSPVISYVSQEEADAEAKRLVEEQGQTYADKNGQCNPSSTEPVWEDVPDQFRCNEGVSEKQQKDTNECSDSYNQTQWVPGGDLTCSWNGQYQKEFTKDDCEEDQQGTTVMVTQDDMESIPDSGYPFTSFEDQEAANALAEAAVEQYGQQVANEKGTCNGCGYYEKMFYRNDCGSCMEDLVGVMVTSDDVGGPFCDPDPEVAQQRAQQAVEENGQAYVNKNGPECTPMSTDPVWVDSDPLETECRDGVSYKKQINTNECYAGEDEQWIPGGGLTCTWTGTCNPKTFYKQCDNDGVGSAVEVSLDDVSGDYTSTVSQEDANQKACALIDAQGQGIANTRGTCTWTATFSKQFTRNNCGTCDKGSIVNVSSDQTSGAPYKSNVSYQDALTKATNAVNSEGQAIANKNGTCTNDTAKDNPNWADTGTTQCSGCTSQKQQRDTNQCSPSYNTTQWVNGGSRNCTENGSWGSWSSWRCNGCTATRTRTNTCGATDTDSESNSSHCGSWGSWTYTGTCSGTRSQKRRTHSCTGETETDYDYRDCYCGYGGGDYNTAVGSAQCRSGVSQRQYRDSCGNTTWKNEGTACTASYNCANYSDSGSCSFSGSLASARGTWTCKGSGTQTANGSTTSAAQSAAQAKCTCSTYSATATGPCTGTCSGSEGDCTYTGTYTGSASGTASGSSSSSTTCVTALLSARCTNCGNRTYKRTYSATATGCNSKCPNGGSSNGVAITTTGSGSTCAAAYDDAIKKREAEFNSNYTKYCNCKAAGGTVRFVLNTSHTYGVNAAIRLSNGAGTSINLGRNGSSSSFTTSPGSYSVGIQTQPGCASSTGVVSQCRSYNISPQNITVVSGQTVTVTMTVNC